ncbi:mitochondrial fission regulator 2 [Diachasma alloeum]|uniref:mitochondrial fission regulator 2 n=1 Tax=Diachasma alloeum TaxID=454923 RepID=UPI0007381E8D|nr:mitochondrial fission regulator 2 [Diachasma alloeum]XP_015117292.1 mitochondrial fission regulator 2 [Diachasma alloeum]XP_015117294.1 mitochondrial fission regulator 2 [Diachasma alloeum]XP_015117295.1 mitochondrial fission regulator 2 [Diachasma alloeum]
MDEAPKLYGRRRSIVRRIGSFLPLKPPPKIYVSVTALHSMSNSMINEESNGEAGSPNDFGEGRLSGSKPDLLEPISFGSEVRLLALEQELQELRTQVSLIVKTSDHSKTHYSSMASLSNGNTTTHQPPPLPPPLPPPTTPHIARRSSLQDHKLEDRKKPLVVQKSMGDMLKDIDKVKLKPIERSPGGRPLRPKRVNGPWNDLQEILRRRYIAMGQTPDSRNSSTLTMDDSF